MPDIIKDLFVLVFVVLTTVGIAVAFGWAIKRFDKPGEQRSKHKPKKRRP